MSEIENSVLENGDHILNAASVLAFDINTGLEGYDVTGGELAVGGHNFLRESGSLVDIHSNAVTERVTEAPLVACAVDDAPLCGCNVSTQAL